MFFRGRMLSNKLIFKAQHNRIESCSNYHPCYLTQSINKKYYIFKVKTGEIEEETEVAGFLLYILYVWLSVA